MPSETSLLDVHTLLSTPPGVHWESSFGMSEVRWLGGRQEVKSSAKGGTRTSPQVSGQQPWELRPPRVSLVGRRWWLQPTGGNNFQALSSTGIFASQALVRELAKQATCCRCIRWAKLPGRYMGGGVSEFPEGPRVAHCSGCYIPQKKAAVLGEAKVEQRTRQKTQQGPPRGGTGGDTWALPWAQDQAGWTSGHLPLFHPRAEGEPCPQNTLLGFFSTRHRGTWISAHVVTKTDCTQTNEWI